REQPLERRAVRTKKGSKRGRPIDLWPDDDCGTAAAAEVKAAAAGETEEKLTALRTPRHGRIVSRTNVDTELACVRKESQVAGEERRAHRAVRIVRHVLAAAAVWHVELGPCAKSEWTPCVTKEPRIEADSSIRQCIGIRSGVDPGRIECIGTDPAA